MMRIILCLFCCLAATAQETVKPDFALPQREWVGQRLAIWRSGFLIRRGELTHTSLRVFDRAGALSVEVDLAKRISLDTTIDDVVRLADGSLVAAVRAYNYNSDKDVESLLVSINSQGQITATQPLTPFRPLRLWLEASGKIAMVGRVSPSDALADPTPETRELVLRMYENGAQPLRMISSKATGLVLPIPTLATSWEPRDIVPAGGRAIVLIARTPAPRFAEISLADGSVVGDWTVESPTIAVEGKTTRRLTLEEFTLTGSHRLIAYFVDAPRERYFELDRATKQWSPVDALNRQPISNLYSASGELLLVSWAGKPTIGDLGFAWVSLEKRAQSINR
jgi:hypothetical protein